MSKRFQTMAMLFGMLSLSCGQESTSAPGVDEGNETYSAADLDLRTLKSDYGEGMDAVVRCMAAEGFQFFVTPGLSETTQSVDPLTFELATAESANSRAGQSGFGIAETLRFAHRFEGNEQADQDDNERYKFSLDTDER